MNIDKNEMTLAYMHRDDPKYFRKFIGFIDQIGEFCVGRLRIDMNYREDVKQIAVEHAFRKMDHYDPTTGSAAYSFFYKVILRRCLYELRDINKKKSRMPSICSLESLYAFHGAESDDPSYILDNAEPEINMFTMMGDAPIEDEDDESPSLCYDPSNDSDMVMINDKPYNRTYAIQKIKEAKTTVRREKLIIRRKRLYSLKTEAYFNVDDEFVRMVCVQIVENKEKKAKSLQRSK